MDQSIRVLATGQARQSATLHSQPLAWIAIGLALLMLAAMASAAKPYKAPRGPDGKHPDLNGIWQALNEANYNLELHNASASVAMREGPQGPVPAVESMYLGSVAAVPPGLGVIKGGGSIPYLPAAAAQRQANAKDWLQRDPEIKCYLPGIPRANYMPYPFQILQGQDSIFFAYEYAGAVRDIFMFDPGEAPVDSWMGQSAGRWEGDTLVIEVTGQNDQTWFDRAGNHHSEMLKVTERFTPRGPDHLWYEATIEDPQTFSEPWTIEMPLYRRVEAGARLMEFRCVEFVEELMFGKWRREPLPR